MHYSTHYSPFSSLPKNNNVKYCFLPSIGQLAMPIFFSAKYMFAMVPTNRAVHAEEKLVHLHIKQDLPLPGSLM